MFGDTIAAIATPPGEGGLTVLRLSGPQAFAVAGRAFVPAGRHSVKPAEANSHTLHYGHIVRHGEVVDEVLISVMRAPRTYTCEDTVEISCHGGVLVGKLVLDALLENGARLAQPGEFTQRAFLNGRIDLAQAEAVADLIRSRTELAVRAANEQLAGKLSRRINQLRDGLMETLAHVEAHLDFPEEDIAPNTLEQLLARLERGVAFMEELLATANEGRILRNGVRVAIVGRPNVGKSSLLNQFLGYDRAIVSPTPGTTRDTIEETANVRGVPVIFVDTAGLREAHDEVELEGIRRSHAAVAGAEIILHVLDGSEPLTAEDERLLAEFADKPRLLAANKADLPCRLELPCPPGPGVATCCWSGQGIEALEDAIPRLVWKGAARAEAFEVMINSRHQEALRRAREAMLQAIEALGNRAALDLAAVDLREAANAVGEIVGKTATEDLLDMIFSQFCIGK